MRNKCQNQAMPHVQIASDAKALDVSTRGAEFDDAILLNSSSTPLRACGKVMACALSRL